MTGTNTSPVDPFRTTMSRAMRIKSAVLAVVAVVIGLLSWLVLHYVAGIAAEHDVRLADATRFWILRPPVVAALALPAAAAAAFGAVARRRTWLWLTATVLLSLLPVVVVLYCFIAVVGTLYRYQAL
jgi:hypothetical protein